MSEDKCSYCDFFNSEDKEENVRKVFEEVELKLSRIIKNDSIEELKKKWRLTSNAIKLCYSCLSTKCYKITVIEMRNKMDKQEQFSQAEIYQILDRWLLTPIPPVLRAFVEKHRGK